MTPTIRHTETKSPVAEPLFCPAKLQRLKHLPYRFFSLLLLVVLWTPLQAQELSASPTTSTDGVLRLSWSLDDSSAVEVQRSQSSDFCTVHTVYRGTDEASVLTGLSDGQYYFRIRTVADTATWSPPKLVTVQHHSLSKAMGFLALGALVFFSTVLLIFFGRKP